jgi:hypothetical protein
MLKSTTGAPSGTGKAYQSTWFHPYFLMRFVLPNLHKNNAVKISVPMSHPTPFFIIISCPFHIMFSRSSPKYSNDDTFVGFMLVLFFLPFLSRSCSILFNCFVLVISCNLYIAMFFIYDFFSLYLWFSWLSLRLVASVYSFADFLYI